MLIPRPLLAGLLGIGCASEAPVDKPTVERIPAGEARLTWLGVTTWLVEVDDQVWLWDAFFSRPIYGAEGSTEAGMNQLDAVLAATGHAGVDGIFVGHSHFDHAVDTGTAALRTGAHVYGSETTCVLAEAQGLPSSRCSVVDGGDVIAMGPASLTVVRTPHWDPAGIGRHAEWTSTSDAEATAVSTAPHGGVLSALLEVSGGASLFYQNTLAPLDADDGSGEDYAQNLSEAFAATEATVWLGAAQYEEDEAGLRRYLDVIQPQQIMPAHWDGIAPDVLAGLDVGQYSAPGFFADVLAERQIELVQTTEYFQRFQLTEDGIAALDDPSVQAAFGL